MAKHKVQVSTEIGRLRKLFVHSPDGGIGKVIPAKAQDWLYEDIVDLKTMQSEYDVYKKTLLAFLDPETLKKWFELEDKHTGTDRPNFLKPGKKGYLTSDYVLEVQQILGEILKDDAIRVKLVSTICGLEKLSFKVQKVMLNEDEDILSKYHPVTPETLAELMISGHIKLRPLNPTDTKPLTQQIFPPIPNFIFTRDIGITVNDNILLSKLFKPARVRESLLMKYMAHYYLFPDDHSKIIEIKEDIDYFLEDEATKKLKMVSVEGGDVMMLHPQHLMIGCSERTSAYAINKLVKRLFTNGIVQKITAVVIPSKRDTMHIDTVFTQVSRDVWLLYGPYSRRGIGIEERKESYVTDLRKEAIEKDEVKIKQFINERDENGRYKIREFADLEEIMTHVSREDFGCNEDPTFIYCGNGNYPDNLREQWTDACNVLALREGVVIGYDRNPKTDEAFKNAGFLVKPAVDLIADLKAQWQHNAEVDLQAMADSIVGEKCLITLPSFELSRARGGSHCMSMPILRDELK